MDENQREITCPARQRLARLGRECKACGRCRQLDRMLEPPPRTDVIHAPQPYSANIERPS